MAPRTSRRITILNSLQIAFRHVWTEVFDTELEALGKELYQEFVKLKDFSGLDNGKD